MLQRLDISRIIVRDNLIYILYSSRVAAIQYVIEYSEMADFSDSTGMP